MNKLHLDIEKSGIDNEGVAVAVTINGDAIMTLTFFREEDGSLFYVIQEDTDDDAPALWNKLPEYFEEQTV